MFLFGQIPSGLTHRISLPQSCLPTDLTRSGITRNAKSRLQILWPVSPLKNVLHRLCPFPVTSMPRHR